ncbi:MAG: hypothetical protein HC899_23630 [Leptolyngbyaceae cyanobacterium SM1_4_3]|nr:hypothetical protein [Leptolyngbyaceae cyanobacterium SM1_4_3]
MLNLSFISGVTHFYEGDRSHQALWVKSDRFKTRELKLVPEAFLEYL